MATVATLPLLRFRRDALKQQADEVTGHMSEAKAQRQALEKDMKAAQLRRDVRIAHNDREGIESARAKLDELERASCDVEESLHALNTKMQMLQREHGLTCGEINRTEAEAANTANRIKALRHDLRRAKNRPASELSSPVYSSMVTSIQGGSESE